MKVGDVVTFVGDPGRLMAVRWVSGLDGDCVTCWLKGGVFQQGSFPMASLRLVDLEKSRLTELESSTLEILREARKLGDTTVWYMGCRTIDEIFRQAGHG